MKRLSPVLGLLVLVLAGTAGYLYAQGRPATLKRLRPLQAQLVQILLLPER